MTKPEQIEAPQKQKTFSASRLIMSLLMALGILIASFYANPNLFYASGLRLGKGKVYEWCLKSLLDSRSQSVPYLLDYLDRAPEFYGAKKASLNNFYDVHLLERCQRIRQYDDSYFLRLEWTSTYLETLPTLKHKRLATFLFVELLLKAESTLPSPFEIQFDNFTDFKFEADVNQHTGENSDERLAIKQQRVLDI